MLVQTQQTYSITVATIKYSESYSYSATDTVKKLKEKIFENEGLPEDQQRLIVQYGWRTWWARVEISDLGEDLLINHLRTASRIDLYIKLRNG